MANRLAEEHNALLREQTANQQKILALATSQPHALMAAIIAAIDGDIGGRVGLGFQTVGYAGAVASP